MAARSSPCEQTDPASNGRAGMDGKRQAGGLLFTPGILRFALRLASPFAHVPAVRAATQEKSDSVAAGDESLWLEYSRCIRAQGALLRICGDDPFC